MLLGGAGHRFVVACLLAPTKALPWTGSQHALRLPANPGPRRRIRLVPPHVVRRILTDEIDIRPGTGRRDGLKRSALGRPGTLPAGRPLQDGPVPAGASTI